MADKANAAEKDSAPPPPSRNLTIPRDFQGELRSMMYGFGDEFLTRPDSVKLMEEMVIEYITGLAAKCTEVAQVRRKDRPEVQDVLFVIRKKPRQLKRVRYLLEMKAVIHRATAVTKDAEEMASAKPAKPA